MTVSGFDGVDKHAKPEKSLLEVLKKHSGRNSYGRITVRHQGGGNRQKYRVIDFKRNKLDMTAKVLRLEYDPNRSAFIALCEYEDGERRYILAPVGLNVGDTIVASAAADIKAGNALPMANIPVGTVIHNIELYPGKGAQLVRSAGVAAQLMAKDANKIEIKKAIEEIFGVTVIKVTTLNVRGKAKRQGAYPMGKTASWKKAVVKLSADSKNIELFEGMA